METSTYPLLLALTGGRHGLPRGHQVRRKVRRCLLEQVRTLVPFSDTSMTTSPSSKYSMVTFLLMMMTSWAIVCDVYYLPPTVKREVTH